MLHIHELLLQVELDDIVMAQYMYSSSLFPIINSSTIGILIEYMYIIQR